MRSDTAGSAHNGYSLWILQTVSPDYRQPVWNALLRFKPRGVVVVAGSSYFVPSVLTRHDGAVPFVPTRNVYLLKRQLLWQLLPLRQIMTADAVIAELNPRILSNWAVLVCRRLSGRRTALWGHAFGRGHASRSTVLLRKLMKRLADVIVVYTADERERLEAELPRKRIIVAPNAVASAARMRPRVTPDASDFVYVGRLASDKRPDLLLKAFTEAAPSLPERARLVLVGDGPMRGKLEGAARAAGLGGRVAFQGHVGDFSALELIYASALASVSPGYVGLSITQSLGFGVPMIIADDEPHSPEIEAANPALNCLFFHAGSSGSLSRAMLSVSAEAGMWRSRADEISRACRERYSTDVMAERLLIAAKLLTRDGPS